MTSIYRILDANLNRATEGLRTIEEFARFILEDGELSGRLKAFRHALAEASNRIDRGMLLQARDTQGDVGTAQTTTTEFHRPTIASVVVAASQRVQQSLRCLEEYGKVVDPDFAKALESLRYQSYDLLATIDLKVLAHDEPLINPERRACSEAQLYLLVDCQLPLESFIGNLKAVSSAGVDWIQIRDKRCDTRQVIEYGHAALAAIDPLKTKILINDRLDIAMAIGAAGVHLGQEDMPIAEARRIAPPSMWIGVSTHSLQQAIQAEAEGADYIGCGPTFPSTTKSFDEYKGTEWLTLVSQQIKIPAFAIGGINLANVEVVARAGIRRVAVSGAIWKAADPATSARQIREKL